MKVKGWQTVVVVLGLLVGGGSAAYSFLNSRGVEIKHVIHAVDVETGVVFRIDTEKFPVVIPAPHPETGRFSLLRVKQDDSGNWHVTGRDLDQIKRLIGGVVNKAVDESTGELRSPVTQVVDYVRK